PQLQHPVLARADRKRAGDRSRGAQGEAGRRAPGRGGARRKIPEPRLHSGERRAGADFGGRRGAGQCGGAGRWRRAAERRFRAGRGGSRRTPAEGGGRRGDQGARRDAGADRARLPHRIWAARAARRADRGGAGRHRRLGGDFAAAGAAVQPRWAAYRRRSGGRDRSDDPRRAGDDLVDAGHPAGGLSQGGRIISVALSNPPAIIRLVVTAAGAAARALSTSMASRWMLRSLMPRDRTAKAVPAFADPAPGQRRTKMQYLLMIYGDESAMANATPENRQVMNEAYATFTKGIVQSGHFKGGERLHPTKAATTVRVRDGKTMLI